MFDRITKINDNEGFFKKGHIDVVKYFLLKASLNSIDYSDSNKRTALHWACLLNHAEIVNLLLKNDIRRDLLDNNNKKAIDYAIDYNYYETLLVFKDNGHDF